MNGRIIFEAARSLKIEYIFFLAQILESLRVATKIDNNTAGYKRGRTISGPASPLFPSSTPH
jgi:hypothetical protein